MTKAEIKLLNDAKNILMKVSEYFGRDSLDIAECYNLYHECNYSADKIIERLRK